MKLHNLKKATDFEVEKWIMGKVPEISAYQKEQIREREIVRFSEFYFYKKRPRVRNFWLRLTIVFIPVVLLILILGLPFYFFATGTWGYPYDKVKWFDTWKNTVDL